MLANTLKNAGIGFLLGMLIGNLITIATSLANGNQQIFFTDVLLQRTGSPGMALLVLTVCSGLYGALCWAGISFYRIETWSLLKAALSHFALVSLGFWPFAVYLGWFELNLESVIVVTGIDAVIYAIIFLCMSARYQREVKQLNDMLGGAA